MEWVAGFSGLRRLTVPWVQAYAHRVANTVVGIFAFSVRCETEAG